MKSQVLLQIQNFHPNQQYSSENESTSQIQILSRPMSKETLSFLKNLKINRIVIPPGTPLKESLQIYYSEYRQLYQENKRLNREFIEVVQEKNELAEIYISKMKLNKALGGKIKRKRRYACQIKREFECPIEECEKRYGTEASLTQHVKIKHDEFFKSGKYDEYISQIIKQKMRFEPNYV